MKTKAGKPIAVSQLPNAPLTEVVFELRWKLEDAPSIPEPLRNDPGYQVLVDGFSEASARQGFPLEKVIAAGFQLSGYNIARRYYRGDDQNFPLWQIGPGIFAANESASYRWGAYRELCLKGARTLIQSYPKMRRFVWTPTLIELRYIDSFGPDLVSRTDLFGFLNTNTNFHVELPSLLKGKLGTLEAGLVVFQHGVAGMKDTLFEVRAGDRAAASGKTIVLESKVFTRSDNLRLGSRTEDQVRQIGRWLGRAHSITSAFFKEFINAGLMDKFRGVTNA